MQEHASGRLIGDVPRDWMRGRNLETCSVCSRLLSTRFGGACPRCRPALQRAADRPSAGRPIPGDWPSLEEVLTARVPVRSHVPAGAKRLWAQCLAAAISEAHTFNDEKAWIQILSLPQMLLRAPARSGKKKKGRSDADAKRRCEEWLEGQRGKLWSSHDAPRKRAPELDRQKEARCSALVKEGLFRKACGALVKDPPVAVTDEVLRDMAGKHPAARDADARRGAGLRVISPAAAPEISDVEIDKAIRSFPRGSAAGPSALRPQHLKEALVPGMRDEVLRQIAALATMLARGEADPVVRPWLCGGSLAALRKQDGGLRPVAVGETWRRLVGKVLSKKASDDIKAYLEPLQVGVGTQGGCEALVHTVRQWMGRNSDNANCVLALLDLSNAFNTVDRSQVRQAIRRVAPSLAPWVDFCYGGDSTLLLGPHRLSSARGVQQGDPLGPALFAIAIHDIILQAQTSTRQAFPGELHFTAFYLDDGVVAGSARAVRSYIDTLEAALADAGLDLNKAKCEVVPTARSDLAFDASLFNGMTFNPVGNFKLLGAPFGSASFCTEHTRKRARKAEALLTEISQLSDTQSALLLLRQCSSFCKLVYSIRSVPPGLHGAALEEFAGELRAALGELIMAEVGDRAWAQAKLGIKRAGLGLRCPSEHAAAAFTASLNATQGLCVAVDSNFSTEDLGGHLQKASAWDSLRQSTLPDASPSPLDRQKTLSAMIDARREKDLRGRRDADGSFQAHLSLCMLPGAGAWLIATPADAARTIDAPLFRIGIKRRLRMQVQAADTFCPLCGGTMDSYGDHALTCPCCGDRTVRHNRARDGFHEDAASAGMRPEREKQGLLPGRPVEDGVSQGGSCDEEQARARQRRRPADVYVPSALRGRPTALDFACTSGLRADTTHGAIADPEGVLTAYEQFKRSYKAPGEQLSTEALCSQQGIDFVPMVAEAHGGSWGPAARKILDAVAKHASATSTEEPETVSLHIAQRLSCSLQRESARAILRRLQDCSAAPSAPSWAPGAVLPLWQ